jgi:hypothetical protein
VRKNISLAEATESAEKTSAFVFMRETEGD